MKNYETVMWLGYSIRSSNWFPMANRENHWIVNRKVITMWQALEATQIPGRYFEEIWRLNKSFGVAVGGVITSTWHHAVHMGWAGYKGAISWVRQKVG